jgi:hypothetical protein
LAADGKDETTHHHLNDKCMKLSPDVQHVDVEESMIPYYSYYGCKQRIQGKLIRYDFKMWSLMPQVLMKFTDKHIAAYNAVTQ